MGFRTLPKKDDTGLQLPHSSSLVYLTDHYHFQRNKEPSKAKAENEQYGTVAKSSIVHSGTK